MTDTRRGRRDEQVTRPLGRFRGRTVHLAVRASPSLEARAPEEFAVTVFVSNPDGSTIDIGRIDTADAGVHFDRLYLPEAHPRRKDYGVTVLDFREAQRFLVENWRGFVAAYDEHHGLP